MSEDQFCDLDFCLFQAAGVINRLLQEYHDFLTSKQETFQSLDYDEIQRLNEIRSSNALDDVFWFLCAHSKQIDMPPDMRPDMQKLYRFIIDKGLYVATVRALNARLEILQPSIESLERQKRIYKDDPLMRTNEEAEYRRTHEILCWFGYMEEKEQHQTAATAADQEQSDLVAFEILQKMYDSATEQDRTQYFHSNRGRHKKGVHDRNIYFKPALRQFNKANKGGLEMSTFLKIVGRFKKSLKRG